MAWAVHERAAQMASKYHDGLGMEREAERELTARGLRTVARNARFHQRGELDLVMEEELGPGRLELVFVEVRVRRPGCWLGGIDAVEPRKRERLIRAAGMYLARYRGAARSARCDLMVWDGSAWSHFRDVVRI